MAVTQAVEWEQGFSDAWSRIAQTGPKIIVFVLLLLVGALAVRVLVRLADRILAQAGADAVLDRTGLPRLLRRPPQALRAALLRLAGAVCLVAVVRVALGLFGPNEAVRTAEDALGILARLLLACFIILIGLALTDAARRVVTEALAGLPHARLAGTAITATALVIFGKAALDELGVGTTVTTPLLYAVLASITGVVVVGVGGGLIRPMQRRWEDVLDRAESEAEQVRAARAARASREGQASWPGGAAGQAPAGPPPTGHLTAGHTPGGHPSAGYAAAGHASAGYTSPGHPSAGHLSAGHPSAGHTAAGPGVAGPTATGPTDIRHPATGPTPWPPAPWPSGPRPAEAPPPPEPRPAAPAPAVPGPPTPASGISTPPATTPAGSTPAGTAWPPAPARRGLPARPAGARPPAAPGEVPPDPAMSPPAAPGRAADEPEPVAALRPPLPAEPAPEPGHPSGPPLPPARRPSRPGS